MGYSRPVLPDALPAGEELAARLVGIGVLLAVRGAPEPVIEDTLVAASIEGMEGDDLRVLALLTTWLDVHHEWVNADRLLRLTQGIEARRTRAYWAAVGAWLVSDRRFQRLAHLHRGRRVDLLRTGTHFRVQRRGEDARFRGTALRVPAEVLRDRRRDVAAPEELAKTHGTYRQRVRMGPSYRADMWALLERDPNLPAAELARRAYGSYGTAWRVKRDFDLLTR